MNLQDTYTREKLLDFLAEFLPDFKRDIRPAAVSGCKAITEGFTLGRSDKLDLQVFEFTHEGSHQKRVTLTNDGLRVMRDTASFQALAVYCSPPDEDVWRLSLLTATPELGKGGKVILKLSNPRRFSFVLGPDAKIATPTRFLLKSGPVSSFEELRERFSVEVVNKEFYAKVATLYTELVGGKRNVGGNLREYSGSLKLPSVAPHSSVMQQFAVRLLGRIVFCWFLREKIDQSGKPLIPSEVLSLAALRGIKGYYHKMLEPLFFEILNKPIDMRKDAYKTNSFGDIPYLNGGLFSPEDDDFYSHDDGRQAINHNLVDVPNSWIEGLFDVLEQYHFTVDENTTRDIDLSIDPEMLGRIFENLLAEINPETGETARKMTGSYYTPRQVVEYMVDRSLISFLSTKTSVPEEKLKALISYDLSDDADYPLSEKEKSSIVDALNKVTILDPACGSGAYPIGVLQKIVYMLQRVDHDAKLWFHAQIEQAPPELRRLIEREFKHDNLDYIRKLGVIRRSIYGSDIQPIATEIARLRCFLTLIVDERVDEDATNRGIEPLPNLDFKFVSANSLVPLPSAQNGGQSELFDDQTGIGELRSLRSEYFTAGPKEREQLKFKFVLSSSPFLQHRVSF